MVRDLRRERIARAGAELGIHLGMGGRIVVTAGDRTTVGGSAGPQRFSAAERDAVSGGNAIATYGLKL